MNILKLKAHAKKKKYFDTNDVSSSDDSDGELTEEDEELVSVDYVNRIYNNRYLCIKYLGRGTFSRVWLVLDIIDNKYYAMKTIFPKYVEESHHEIEVHKKLQPIKPNNVLVMEDSFLDNKRNELCLITKLLGKSVNELLMFEGDNQANDNESNPDIDTESNPDIDNDNLSEKLNDVQFRSPSLRLLKKFIRDVSSGLCELHSRNMVHTDLKFENVLIDIISDNLNKIISHVNALELCNKYHELMKENTPNNYDDLDKAKKKKVKRKIKDKTMKMMENLLKENNCLNFDTINFVENNQNIYDLENLNFDTFKFIVIDLGNVEYINDRVQDEIMMRNYRPPENIISEYYDCKADIWNLGCLVYEFITNNFLFEVSRKRNSIDRDRYHLHKMYEYLGKMPKEMTLNCDFSKDLFDKKGNILKKKNYDFTDIEELLLDESTYEENEITEVCNFLKKLLVYNPNIRLSSKQCYENEWLKSL
jgi:serine/threonine-protein kinase SRPK3